MNLINELIVNGPATVTGGPSSPYHVTRLAELAAGLATKSNLGHTHDASEITGLTVNLLAGLADVLGASSTVTWIYSGTPPLVVGAQVVVRPGGGLTIAPTGLGLDSGVSRAGHTHVNAEVTDFAAGVLAASLLLLQNSETVLWAPSGTGTSGSQGMVAQVKPKASGGLRINPEGLGVDFGTEHFQVAYGDHEHSGVHPAATMTSGDGSLAVTGGGPVPGGPTAQAFDVRLHLAPGSGLTVGPSGTGLDFGTGHNQVPRGDAVALASQLHPALTAQGDVSLALGVGSDQLLSGTVRVDPSPGGGYGRLAKGSGGLKVVLGTAADTAAEGDHTHNAATESVDGYLSAADKRALNLLSAASGVAVRRSGLWVSLDGYGSDIPVGMYDFYTLPDSGVITGWDLATAGPSGTLRLDILKGTFAGWPPAVSLVGAFAPILNSGTHAQNLTVNWVVQRGDVLGIKVTSCGGVKRAVLGLRITQ